MFAVKLIANLNFEHAEHVNISDFPYYLKYNWSLLKAVNNVLVSYTKLCYVKFKWANQSCSPSKISQSMLNGALVIEMVNNSFSEIGWKQERFEKAWNVLKNENICLLNLVKCLRYSGVQKNSNVVNNWNRFQQVRSLF